jgi:superfamily I DNA and RNA helicase
LGEAAKDDEQRFLRLGEEQRRCIDEFLFENSRALVSGGPGSGKTLIAAEAARRLASDGSRVLFICFTEPLSKWLRSLIGSTKIDVWAIKRLAIQFLELAEKPPNVPVRREDWTPAFWQSVTPLALSVAGEAIDAGYYDAIVVDEGQDLDADDWKLIERLSQSNRRLWVFHDPSQKLWLDRQMPTEPFAKYRLRSQHRCAEPIAVLAALYQSEVTPRYDKSSASISLKSSNDRRVVVTPCRTRKEVPRALAEEIDQLLNEGFDRGNIAIVSLVSRTDRNAIAGLRTLGRHTVVRADDEAMRNEIVADSVYRFKGLERSAIMLTDLSLRKPEENLMRRPKMNVAITRARSVLRIIDT